MDRCHTSRAARGVTDRTSGAGRGAFDRPAADGMMFRKSTSVDLDLDLEAGMRVTVMAESVRAAGRTYDDAI
jgi:hypothetical protein